ncbi:MAG: hypothetical protein JXA77_16905 [Bacteroidales bacterium]|nr:hypothetical protein [Bacteroidales bacterium]MBN2819381.1 hypothetical protein [Bacteroidales bacterium]
MKLYITLLGLFLLSLLQAQDNDEFKTIFSGREMNGYGSFSLGASMIDTSAAIIFSSRGGVILGHSFAMGLGGSGFVTKYQEDPYLNMKASLSGGYGGVFMELILFSRSPVHLSVPVLAGIGEAMYSSWINEGTDYRQVNEVEDASTFLVVEPGVNLEFNLSKNVRLAACLNMRYTTDLNITRTTTSGGNVNLVSPDALNGYSTGVIIKFGKF